MIDRRQLLTWWRVKPPAAPPPREVAPALTRVVEPTPIDAAEPFSLERFYAARAAERP